MSGGGKLKFYSEAEVGWKPARDRIRWNVTAAAYGRADGASVDRADVLVNGRVMDSSGKVVRKMTEGSVVRQGKTDENKVPALAVLQQTLVAVQEVEILVEPRDDQPPQAAALVGAVVLVDEGGTEIISPEMVSVNDTDTRTDQLTVWIDEPPVHGYLEVRDDRKGISSGRIAVSHPHHFLSPFLKVDGR